MLPANDGAQNRLRGGRGESGNVAAYSALLAVDKKFDVIAVLKLVRVSCLLQRLLRIIVLG